MITKWGLAGAVTFGDIIFPGRGHLEQKCETGGSECGPRHRDHPEGRHGPVEQIHRETVQTKLGQWQRCREL